MESNPSIYDMLTAINVLSALPGSDRILVSIPKVSESGDIKIQNLTMNDIASYINTLVSENKRLHETVAIHKGAVDKLVEECKTLESRIISDLRSKFFKYKRKEGRIYTPVDFEDGEILQFYSYPDKPSSKNEGYGVFKGKHDIRTIHFDEVEEVGSEATVALISKYQADINRLKLELELSRSFYKATLTERDQARIECKKIQAQYDLLLTEHLSGGMK